MENVGILKLFEELKKDFRNLTADNFSKKAKDSPGRFDVYLAISQIRELLKFWNPLNTNYHIVLDEKYPKELREKSLIKLYATLDEIIALIKSGATETEKRKIPEEVVVLISDKKVKKICIEINNTPDENTISLMSSVGLAMYFTLLFKAKSDKIKLKSTEPDFGYLLKRVLEKKAYKDNASNRYIGEFRDNFMKTNYDMLRHSESYVPETADINPVLGILQYLLSATFKSS